MARTKIERAMAINPRNAHGAHIRAHVYYEDGEMAAARDYLTAWLPGYPREAQLHCHLNWHLALSELALGNMNAAWDRYADAIDPEVTVCPPLIVLADAAAFLWRAELAGGPRDPIRWQAVRDYAHKNVSPRAGMAFADAHIVLTDAVTGDGAALETRLRELHDLAGDNRLPSRWPAGARAGQRLRGLPALRLERRDRRHRAHLRRPRTHRRQSRATRSCGVHAAEAAYLNAGRLEDLHHSMSRTPLRTAGGTHVAGLGGVGAGG